MTMTMITLTRHTALAVSLAFGSAIAAPSAGVAMEIFNCTSTAMPVRVSHAPSGQNFGTARVAPGQGMAWSTGAGRNFDVQVQAAGSAKRFRNRNGQSVLSIALVSGQPQLLDGYQCQKTAIDTHPRANPPERRKQANTQIQSAVVGAVLGILVHHATKD